jgi:hypothetical protein
MTVSTSVSKVKFPAPLSLVVEMGMVSENEIVSGCTFCPARVKGKRDRMNASFRCHIEVQDMENHTLLLFSYIDT